jgi:A/G-specific adenine glycosylase
LTDQRARSGQGAGLGCEFTPATPRDLQDFRTAVLAHYRDCGRDLPWRRTRVPYHILVSEVMLQQTQVARVIARYGQFLAAFPTVLSLADATAADVLAVWQGLGYNRRALALHRAARLLTSEHRGEVPRSLDELRRLPGVGTAIAAAVCVFAYDVPLPFIETNIRSAFIHFFFQECVSVSDADLLPLVKAALDRENPRDWYYALMDYGAWVKKTYPNPGRKSKHHAVQAPFPGSRRQARALILHMLLSAAPSGMSPAAIQAAAPLSGQEPAWIDGILEDLRREGFLVREGQCFRVV